MCEGKTDICDVNVPVDSIFTVKLESQVGSTGYSWALAHMPDSVNLLDVSFETAHSHICGSSETQVFTFVALTEDQNYLEFKLLRPWSPEDVADKRTYALIVTPKETTDNALEETAGCRKYASFCDTSGTSGLVMMYMPPVFQGSVKYMAPAGLKYMGPPVLKYMAPVDSDSNKDNTEK